MKFAIIAAVLLSFSTFASEQELTRNGTLKDKEKCIYSLTTFLEGKEFPMVQVLTQESDARFYQLPVDQYSVAYTEREDVFVVKIDAITEAFKGSCSARRFKILSR